MARFNLSVHFEPGQAHLEGLLARAELVHSLGLISALPKLSVRPSQIQPFWIIELDIEEKDRLYWVGFNDGKWWCNDNRSLTMGIS